MIYEQERVDLANAIMKNIRYYSNKTKGMKKIYDILTNNAKDCIKIGLCEMSSLKPNMWDAWYLINHGRFTLSGNEQRAMHTIMYYYLSAYCHKKIGQNISVDKITSNS